MVERRLVTSRGVMGWLGGAALLLLAGGCLFVYDFDEYKGKDAGGGAAGGAGGAMPSTSSSGSTSSGSSSSGSGCTDVDPTCNIETINEDTIVDADNGPYADVGLSDTRLFALKKPGLVWKEKETGGFTTELGSVGVTSLAVIDDATVYLGEYGVFGEIIHFVLDGDTVTHLGPGSAATGLLRHGDYAYWFSSDGATIFKGNAMGMPTALPDNPGPNPSTFGGFDVADPNDIYWTFKGNGGGDGGVLKLGDPAPPFVDAQYQPSGIAVDQDAVYWMTADGAVHKKAKSGGAVVDNVSTKQNLAHVTDGKIAVNSTHVYWLGLDLVSCVPNKNCFCPTACSIVWAVPKATFDAPATPVAKADWTSLEGLAVDDAHVYWSAMKDKQTYLLRKPALK